MGEEDYIDQERVPQQINLEENSSSNHSKLPTPSLSDLHNNEPPSMVNHSGETIIINTSTIRVGKEYFKPTSELEVDTLVSQKRITVQQKKIFQLQYEANYGPLSKEPTTEKTENKAQEKTEQIIPRSILPQTIQSTEEKPVDNSINIKNLTGGGSENNTDNELGEVVDFKVDNEAHKIWVEEQGNSIEVMMASDPTPIRKKITEWEGIINTREKEKDKDFPKDKAESMLAIIKNCLDKTDGLATESKNNKNTKDKGNAKTPKENYQIEQSQIALKEAIKRMIFLVGHKDGDEVKIKVREEELEFKVSEFDKKRISEYYDIAILGVGSSSARWLYTNLKQYDKGVVIGKTGGWNDRGQEYISHPKSIVSPKTPSIKDQSQEGSRNKNTNTKFEKAKDHVDDVESIIKDSGFLRVQESINSVQKVKGSPWSLINYGNKGESIAAKKIVMATGAGPEREIAEDVKNKKDDKLGYKKIVSLNEFMSEVEGLTPEDIEIRKKKWGERSVLIYGGNGAVDALDVALKLGFEVNPRARSGYTGHLPGTKNVTSKDKYEKQFTDEDQNQSLLISADQKSSLIAGNYVSHEFIGNGKISVQFEHETIEVDQFVTSIGPESDQIAKEGKEAGPIAILGGPEGIKDILQPIYDLGKAYSDDEFATILGLESDDQLLEVIGAAAFRTGRYVKDTQAAVDRLTELKKEKVNLEKEKVDLTANTKKLEELEEMLKTFESVASKFDNARVAHSKSVIVSEQLGTLNSTIEAINRVNAVMADENLEEARDKQIKKDGINMQIDSWISIQQYILIHWTEFAKEKKDSKSQEKAEKAAKAVVKARKTSKNPHGIVWETATSIIKSSLNS